MPKPGIIAAESPNPIVNDLVIMPDIEKRLEAFVRLAHGIVVFPGGVGTAEAARGRLQDIGFGNLNFSEGVIPPLTTVHVDGPRIGLDRRSNGLKKSQILITELYCGRLDVGLQVGHSITGRRREHNRTAFEQLGQGNLTR